MTVKEILNSVSLQEPTTLQAAEELLVKMGRTKVPELLSANKGLTEVQQSVLASAVLRLVWGNAPRDILDRYFAEIGEPKNAKTELLGTPALLSRFLKRAFYSVHFREWPVAARPSEPFAQRNIVSLTQNGECVLFTDVSKLSQHFGTWLGPTKESEIKSAAEAWLRISQVFSQDGYFVFRIEPKGILVRKEGTDLIVTGKATVEPRAGDTGNIAATMRFQSNRAGEFVLKGIKEHRTVQPGVRPICQARKLLDADPVVRKMAERDLLIMGMAAKDYLFEVRAQATPALRAAIDRIWQRILRGER